MNAQLKKLHALAIKARENAHSPYSHFQVGAAVLTESGNTYIGCNVENASYGGTICAERSALVSAVSAEGKIVIKDIVVVTEGKKPWPPCGICRQFIAEFATKKTKIHIANEKEIQSTFSLEELLPLAFSAKNFKSN